MQNSAEQETNPEQSLYERLFPSCGEEVRLRINAAGIIKNIGGKALLYKAQSCFRIIFRMRTLKYRLSHARFSTLEKAKAYARRTLLDHATKFLLAPTPAENKSKQAHVDIYTQENDDGTYPSTGKRRVEDRTYRVEWRELRQRHLSVGGHDELCKSYWFKRGAGQALRETRLSVPSWVL